jgi:hypothetical protein
MQNMGGQECYQKIDHGIWLDEADMINPEDTRVSDVVGNLFILQWDGEREVAHIPLQTTI